MTRPPTAAMANNTSAMVISASWKWFRGH
jgi:hypothetical protein